MFNVKTNHVQEQTMETMGILQVPMVSNCHKTVLSETLANIVV